MLNLECDYKLEGDTLYRLDIFTSLNVFDIVIISLFNICKLRRCPNLFTDLTFFSLKWYRDDKEFFRYIPRGEFSTRIIYNRMYIELYMIFFVNSFPRARTQMDKV